MVCCGSLDSGDLSRQVDAWVPRAVDEDVLRRRIGGGVPTHNHPMALHGITSEQYMTCMCLDSIQPLKRKSQIVTQLALLPAFAFVLKLST